MLLCTDLKFSGKQECGSESKVKDAQDRAVLLGNLNYFSAAQHYFTEILFHLIFTVASGSSAAPAK